MINLFALFGRVLSVASVKLAATQQPSKELKQLKTLFEETQYMSLVIQKELEDLIEKHDIRDEHLFADITYGACLEQMKQSFQNEFSDEVYKKIHSAQLTTSTLLAMSNDLETQIEKMTRFQARLDTMKNFFLN